MAAKKPPPPHPKADELLSLRRAGVSFSVIAQRLGFVDADEAQAVWTDCAAALRVRYSTDLELDRLDRMFLAVWPAAQKGDTDAIDRALKIMAQRERLSAVPKDNDGAVADAFERSVATSTNLVDGLDDALVAAGRKIAQRIDEATASGDGMEITKALYLVPHMMNALRAMLATPAARIEAGLAVPGKGQSGGGQGTNNLAKLRQIAGGKQAS